MCLCKEEWPLGKWNTEVPAQRRLTRQRAHCIHKTLQNRMSIALAEKIRKGTTHSRRVINKSGVCVSIRTVEFCWDWGRWVCQGSICVCGRQRLFCFVRSLSYITWLRRRLEQHTIRAAVLFISRCTTHTQHTYSPCFPWSRLVSSLKWPPRCQSCHLVSCCRRSRIVFPCRYIAASTTYDTRAQSRLFLGMVAFVFVCMASEESLLISGPFCTEHSRRAAYNLMHIFLRFPSTTRFYPTQPKNEYCPNEIAFNALHTNNTIHILFIHLAIRRWVCCLQVGWVWGT